MKKRTKTTPRKPTISGSESDLEAKTNMSRVRSLVANSSGGGLSRASTDSEVGLRETFQVAPGGTMTFYYWGPPGATVTVRLVRIPNSGGHNHGGATSEPLAVGQVSPTSFVLGPTYPQNARVVYQAPEACGSVRVIASFSQGAPPEFEMQAEVMLSGLLPISSTTNLRLKPPTAEHPSPYWATRGMIKKLDQLANTYAAKTGKPITITDASLNWGGRFDLNQDWKRPHAEHRDGQQADIRSNDMTDKDKKVFVETCAQVGLSVLEESNHWHVRG